MGELLAGLDVGTTSTKAVLLTEGGDEVSIGHAPTVWHQTERGTEIDPSALSDAAHAALAEALYRAGSDDRVVALGVASMGESGVLVGADDTPLADIIAWHDVRDSAELRALDADLGGDEFSTRTGLPLWTQWSLTKHRWLVDHVPATRMATHRYNVAEWVARSLGAEPVTELSLASRTGWLDLATATPWAEGLDWSGSPRSLLGDLVTAGEPVGAVPADHPLSQLRGAVLTIAGHDHQAAALGVGAVGENAEFDSCGTAEALLRTVRPPLERDAILALTAAGVTVGWHVVRGRWCLLGATQGGLVLQRVLAGLGVAREGLAALDEAALSAAPSTARVDVHPESGDYTVSGSTAPGDVWRAATWAVTVLAEDLSRVISRAAGPRRDLIVAGGWTNSSALLAAKRAALGPLRRASASEAGGRGAALLAGLAHGTYASYADLPVSHAAPITSQGL